MEFVNEVTAHLENKPGRLAKICSALAHEKIDIQALCVMDTADRSVLRFVTSDLEPTKRVMTSLGTEFEVGEVLAVEMDHRPGALARLLERLAEEHINIDYAYASSSTSPSKSLGIFRTSNQRRALQILNESTSSANGIDRPGGRRPLHSR